MLDIHHNDIHTASMELNADMNEHKTGLLHLKFSHHAPLLKAWEIQLFSSLDHSWFNAYLVG